MEEFSDDFMKQDVISSSAEDFDPFNIGVATTTNAKSESPASPQSAAVDDNKSILSVSSALPPRIIVKFKIQEEVSSISYINEDEETGGSSDVQIEGTVLAQVVSSDAKKNIPFFIIPSADDSEFIDFKPNKKYANKFTDENGRISKANISIVNIPKETFGFVDIGCYRVSQSMEHMPLLLEQKVVRSKSKIQIAIQVRSKLTNPDDLKDFSIAVHIPKQVDEKSVSIATGDGDFEPWKRCIIWEKENLPKGQSFMVSAKCLLDKSHDVPEGTSEDDGLRFPVMMRCRSKDQISSVQVQALEATGHPASVSSSVIGQTYRIVHRLK
mmetsp:Transcript_5053/g.12916  ORF Transcript_5053/g.12916 Transcript_5053/m.12916 type:complete len:326 (+) Transcript_5053:127-1104(+)|eukprot:CAMPEP_0197188386 /NCGR_PEP_ID=MMETSP1423-20130617/17695_1 /TAXON_ID=476441 /ORGANISM="Pseudo-nitzschia heimii, Strain UNC1101" /LENGTH=325 /DNA_ID=CAMNT_0042640195 /DNA_START=49 /DNA_END=1026 /DNA_ORIENTATION=-